MKLTHVIEFDQNLGGRVDPGVVYFYRSIFGGDVAALVVPAGRVTAILDVARDDDVVRVTLEIDGRSAVVYEFSTAGIGVEKAPRSNPWAKKDIWSDDDAPPAAPTTRRATIRPYDEETR